MGTVEIDRKTFTFTWKIKNFSFCWYKDRDYIFSPPFLVHKSNPVSWRLMLCPNTSFELIICVLCLEPDSSFLESYELAFLTHNESTLNSVKGRRSNFFNGIYISEPLNVYRDAVFGEERAAFLPNDTLTIQCRIWTSEGTILETARLLAETEIETQCNSSTWIIERFSSIQEGQKIYQDLDLTSITKPYFSFSLYLKDGMYITVMKSLDVISVKFCKCQWFLLDAAGKRIKCGSYEFLSKKKEKNTLPLTRAFLLENKSQYLPDDVLSLQIEVEFSTGREMVKIIETDSSQNLLEVTNSTTDNFPYPAENYTKSSLSWKDDLLSIFNDHHFCDTVLKTSSESFPVHSLILRIRSPVFSDMLSVDNCEGLKDGVYIEDLDANTLDKMVLYLYTDTLDNLNWESAKNLYFASNKYEITSLKQVCASFLIKNLEPANCCDILCMAGRYQDHGLISAVQYFISKHAKEIVGSDAWLNLEENNSSLACKTLRKLYLKN